MSTGTAAALSPLKQAFLALEATQARLDALMGAKSEPVAVVGLGCRFPGAADPASYWLNLRNGVDSVREVPPSRWDVDACFDPDPAAPGKTYSRWGGFLDQVDQFDPQFFGISPREAQGMDPQQRLLLEVAWEALEDAGQAPGSLAGTRTGVFIGIAGGDYAGLQLAQNDLSRLDAYYGSGIAHSIASGRLSYVLGLQGPSLSIDTACSSSLVAVHLACQSLRSGECRMALAGGVNVILSPVNAVAFSRSRMLSPTGRCRTFDASADGFVEGEGCGVVVLKRLGDAQADGDRILALIRGSAVNQDGPSSGLTAPNGPAQEAVIREALISGGVRPADVSYVEAHGTGTSLGDPIEVRALGAVFREGRAADRPFVLGAVKTNIGHLEAAAGIAGLIKVVLSLQHREIPPHLHLHTPNPHVLWEDIPAVIPTQPEDWRPVGGGRIAGVSSFGFSGTNAHVVVEEAPAPTGPAIGTGGSGRPLHLLALSARSDEALRELASRYAQHLGRIPGEPLPDVCYSANTGRAHFSHRLALIAASPADLRDPLQAFAQGENPARGASGANLTSDAPKIAFLFTGQGAQYAGMGRRLYETQPVFREALDRCAGLLKTELDRPLLSVLYPEHGPGEPRRWIDETACTQPALFAVEYALSELWRAWGIRPAAVMGHSVGEYAAACVAGVFGLEDGLKLVAARGRLMQALPRDGEMAAVFAGESRVARAVARHAARVSIAAVNGPDATVISGARDEVRAILAALAAEGIQARPLNVSHAFHSPLVEPMLDDFERQAGTVAYAEPGLRVISNITGQAAGAELAQPAYWRRHARAAVRFEAGMHALRQFGCTVFLEIGPQPTLLGMGKRCLPDLDGAWLPSLREGSGEWETMLGSLAALYARGAGVDWQGFDRGGARRRVSLPTYPFQREHYWIDLRPRTGDGTARASGDRPPAAAPGAHPLLGTRLRSALKAVQFESQLDATAQAVLKDHCVFGLTIVPAAVYVEMALAAAAEAIGPTARMVEDLVIHEACCLPGDGRRICQTILEPADAAAAALQILSQGEGPSTWSLHVSGRVRASDGRAPRPVSLAELRARCTQPVPAEAHYAGLAAFGFDFGPSLRGVQRIWRQPGGGEALAEVELPALQAGELDAYRIHPALLDACLQAVAAAVPSGQDAYLPVHLEQFQLHAAAGRRAWSHIVLRPGQESSGEVRACDIRLLDDDGRVLAEARGLHLKRADRTALERSLRRAQARDAAPADWLYETQWRPQPLAGEQALPGLDALAGRMGAAARLLAAGDDVVAHDGLVCQLEALATACILRAFEQLGWRPGAGERVTLAALSDRLGVTERYRRLLARFLDILAEDRLLARDGDGWRVLRTPDSDDPQERLAALAAHHPADAPEIVLMGRCGPQLAPVLRGEADPLQLLFPGGSTEAAEQLYQGTPLARLYNALAREVVSGVVGAWPPGRAVRILEIGGGTGGTTAHLLPALPAAATEYWFTDISPRFVAQAQRKFAGYPFVRCLALDIEQEPAGQGFPARQFDVVVAANVVHATTDVRQSLEHARRLLAPGGVLILLEVTARQRWVDITFGLTDGWWRFADGDLRLDYPLLPARRWLDALSGAGFVEATAFPAVDPETDAGVLSRQSILLARNPMAPAGRPGELREPVAPGAWLILADDGGAGAALAAWLESRGEPCVVAWRDSGELRAADGRRRLDASRRDEFQQLLRDAFGDTPCLGVVHLWSLDIPMPGGAGSLEAGQAIGCGSALYLAQAMLAAPWPGQPPRLWLVTRGAQPAAPVEEPLAVAQAPVWGLGSTIGLEHPELRCTLVDLDPAAAGDMAQLMAELHAESPESRVAFRRGARCVARLARVAPGASRGLDGDGAVRLEALAKGTFDSLALRRADRRAPGAGEVEIEVHASGLNFRDVMNVLALRDDPELLGSECSGRVTRLGAGVADVAVGDAVVAIAEGSFGTHVIARAELVWAKPESLSFAQAATLPLAFLTAHYALNHVARISPADTVLIHAAAGGVGLAAVQLAQLAGADLYATAGSDAKRDYLRSLGVQHVMDSRTLQFAGEMAAILPQGVSIVLNSLAGDFIPASLGVLSADGCFLEIGKRGAWSPQQAARLKPRARYAALDVAELVANDPGTARRLVQEVLDRMRDGSLKPLPLQTWPLSSAPDAFRCMAQARHIGKIVLVPRQDGGAGALIRGDATYLVTGGLGGLGLCVAAWLVERGARNLVLIGRSGASSEARAAIGGLEQAGVRVRVAQADVAEPDQVAGILAQAGAGMPPLRGVIHAAGVLDDGALVQLDWPRFRTVMAPKVDGAWQLHTLTRAQPLDFFILFSSAASLLGARGQANHAAANAFMDALAHYRRSEGLPGLSVNWGAWSKIGAAARQGTANRAATLGLGVIEPGQGTWFLEEVLGKGFTQVGVLPVDWAEFSRRDAAAAGAPFLSEMAGALAPARQPAALPRPADAPAPETLEWAQRLAGAAPSRRRALLSAYVKEQVGKVLGVDPAKVRERVALSEMGLDSLMAVDLRTLLGRNLGLQRALPATLVFDCPSVEALADYLEREALHPLPASGTALAAGVAENAGIPEAGTVSGLLGALEGLSDEEVDRLLEQTSGGGTSNP